MNNRLMFTAWKKLVIAYGIAMIGSMLLGSGLIWFTGTAPETVFELSTRRLAYAFPVLDAGSRAGIDSGLLLFIWNAAGAMVTISFIYTATLLNPQDLAVRPHRIRKLFCGKSRMRLLCFLPGCSQIEAEPVRRLYVWLMIPLLSLVLLGIESGLALSTAKYIFGSYWTGILAMLPHGILEIPAFALAGAVTYSAHLMIREKAHRLETGAVFQELQEYQKQLPIKKTATLVVLTLLLAGLCEAHITTALVKWSMAG